MAIAETCLLDTRWDMVRSIAGSGGHGPFLEQVQVPRGAVYTASSGSLTWPTSWSPESVRCI